MAKSATTELVNAAETAECGLIMPISSTDGCGAEHWLEVRSLLEDAIKQVQEPRLNVRLVSEADDVGVIQKRIVQNVYGAALVVCDVSGKNPNVMFELGMRLAFDKPTIIVKDDKTEYSFDTGIIEHLTYPRDLRFAKIVSFKAQLVDKLGATYKASKSPDHSTFLKNFGTFKVAALTQAEAPAEQLMLEQLQELQGEVRRLRTAVMHGSPFSGRKSEEQLEVLRRAESERASIVRRRRLRLQELLASYRAENPTEQLEPSEKMMEYLQENLPGPDFFDSRDEFRTYVGRYLEQLKQRPSVQ